MSKEVHHKVATGLIKWYMEKKGFRGFTSAWDTVYYMNTVPSEGNWLRNHEMVHIQQMRDIGKIKFMVLYMIEDWKMGYWNNKYEVAARAAERPEKRSL